MSFLNPIASSPQLGVDITSLLQLSDRLHNTNGPDATWAVHTAESAGADAIVLTLSEPVSTTMRANIDAVLATMTESQLTVPLSEEMLDLVCAARPTSVCFKVGLEMQLGATAKLDYAAVLRMIQRAVTRCDAASARVITSIDPAQISLDQLKQAGVMAVEFDTTHFAMAPAAGDNTELQPLQEAIAKANQLGISVQLSRKIQYHHAAQFAALGDVGRMNIGQAIVARAVMVGWAAAIREMKALLVASFSPVSIKNKSHTVPDQPAAIGAGC